MFSTWVDENHNGQCLSCPYIWVSPGNYYWVSTQNPARKLNFTTVTDRTTIQFLNFIGWAGTSKSQFEESLLLLRQIPLRDDGSGYRQEETGVGQMFLQNGQDRPQVMGPSRQASLLQNHTQTWHPKSNQGQGGIVSQPWPWRGFKSLHFLAPSVWNGIAHSLSNKEGHPHHVYSPASHGNWAQTGRCLTMATHANARGAGI